MHFSKCRTLTKVEVQKVGSAVISGVGCIIKSVKGAAVDSGFGAAKGHCCPRCRAVGCNAVTGVRVLQLL